VVLLGRYIVDMLAPSLKLVVEVDGRCHQLKRGAARRDRALAQAGYTVVRVDAHTVLRALPLAVGRVKQAVDERLRG
jgi:very-short-patch-repair endonuclease